MPTPACTKQMMWNMAIAMYDIMQVSLTFDQLK